MRGEEREREGEMMHRGPAWGWNKKEREGGSEMQDAYLYDEVKFVDVPHQKPSLKVEINRNVFESHPLFPYLLGEEREEQRKGSRGRDLRPDASFAIRE